MALKKTVTLESGFTADYHKIDMVHLECTRGEWGGFIGISIYKDKETRDAGCDRIGQIRLGIDDIGFNKTKLKDPANIFALLYDHLKTGVSYSDAEDC